MSQYDVLFDIQQRAPDWGTALLFVLFIVIGSVASFFTRKRSGDGDFRLKVASAIVLSILVGAYFCFETVHLGELKNALRSGRAAMVEGVVTHYETGTNHNADYFFVGAHRFTVWPPMASPAYRQTDQPGGPSLLNRCVKVKYIGDEIVWLAAGGNGCA